MYRDENKSLRASILTRRLCLKKERVAGIVQPTLVARATTAIITVSAEAATAFFASLGLVDVQCASADVVAVELLNRRLAFLLAVAATLTASAANVVRARHLATIRALDISRALQGVVRPAHVAARLGGLFLRNSHRFLPDIFPATASVSVLEGRYV